MSSIKSEANATVPASFSDPASAWLRAGDHLEAMQRRLYLATRTEGDLDEACRYHWQKPGKWFRARLALTLCHDFQLDDDDALNLATACECFRNASLVHDDLQDRNLRRRDQDTVWYRFGNAMAIALGNHLLLSGYRAIMREYGLLFLADPDPQTACYWMARLCNSPTLEHGAHYLQQRRARIRAGLAALPGSFNHLLSHSLEQALLG